MLTDPTSVCQNMSTLSPYTSLSKKEERAINKSNSNALDENSSCNSCICLNGKPKCSNIWCGLPNCLNSNSTMPCEAHEVCVPALQESCLSPPCLPRGDCRALEPSRRVAPPKLLAKTDCWPNQSVLSENCARISILLENKRVLLGTSVEGVCLNLRILLGTRLVKMKQDFSTQLLIILCDIKNDANDTIEVTVVSFFYYSFIRFLEHVALTTFKLIQHQM